MARTYPELVVDIHTHLFNARFLPLKGVLESKGVPGWLAVPARTLFNLLTGKADFIVDPGERFEAFVAATDQMDQLGDALAQVVAAEMAARTTAGDLISFETGSLEESTASLSALRTDDLYTVLEEIEGLYYAFSRKPPDLQARQLADVRKVVAGLSERAEIAEVERLGFMKEWLYNRFRKSLRWLLKQLKAKIRSDAIAPAADYVKFILLMLSSEAALCDTLLNGYRPEQNVNLVVHLMMDMQKAFSNEQPYYPFYKTQIKRMADVVNSSHGRVTGFVAFDPRRSDGLKIVKYGLRRGNCGVKIYPPLGYLPFGNTIEERARFEQLYRHCQQERIPILAHCSPVGFEARKGDGVRSDPDGWVEVLETFPDLLLAYGHAGGRAVKNVDPATGKNAYYPGWYAKNDGEWNSRRNFARKVVEHCWKYPNVYCDFSYFIDMLDDKDKARRFKQRFIAAYQDQNHDHRFADKAMYGSDWPMPRMSRRQGEYLDFMIDLFKDPALKPHKAKFFYKNAQRFLNL